MCYNLIVFREKYKKILIVGTGSPRTGKGFIMRQTGAKRCEQILLTKLYTTHKIIMKKKQLLILILFFLSINVFSQNHIYIGNKSYNSTSEWIFLPVKRTFSDDEILVQIGKSSTGGLLMLTIASEYGKASIIGSMLVYLKNGKVITLLKKIANDYANDKISVIYSIGSNDLVKMKSSNIIDIRFTYISPFRVKMGLNARNGQKYNNGMQVFENFEIETTTEIKNLFNK